MSEQRDHSPFPAAVPPEECLRSPATGNGTQEGPTTAKRSVGHLALWLEDKPAAEIAKGKCEINVSQFIAHFAAKAAERRVVNRG